MKQAVILCFLMQCMVINAQFTFYVKDLTVSNLRTEDSNMVIDELTEHGPLIEVKIVFSNKTDSTITLYPSTSDITVLFNYNKTSYVVHAFPLAFLEKDTIKVSPCQSEEISFGERFLIGTGIMNCGKEEYLIDMIEILPTLKIRYKDRSTDIKTSEILNVEVR